jgi:hypothetical protein
MGGGRVKKKKGEGEMENRSEKYGVNTKKRCTVKVCVHVC